MSYDLKLPAKEKGAIETFGFAREDF